MAPKQKESDNTLLYTMMISTSLLMAVLPFVIFMGIGTITGFPSTDWRVWAVYLLIAVVLSYLLSLGAFALLQRYQCGSVKNMSQISTNATISLAIQGFTLSIVTLVPWFRNLVMNVLPPDTDVTVRDSVGYSYYSLWAMLFGVAIGGNLSRICV